MKRTTSLRRKTGLKRTRLNPGRPVREEMSPEKQAWLDEGVRQRVCAVTQRLSGWNGPGREGQPYQIHHVLLEQRVERHWGVAYTLAHKYDTRNALRIATWVHELHHTASKRIELRFLRDENIAYAFELLGPAAYDYFKRHYAGWDPRVELALAEAEARNELG